MSARLLVWNANAACERGFDVEPRGMWMYPWTVTIGRPRDVADFLDMFESLPEAHTYAMDYAARLQP